MDAKGAQALKERIEQAQRDNHVCKIFTVVEGKTVCVYCGKERE